MNHSVVHATFYRKRNIVSAPQMQQICEGHPGFTDTDINFRANATIFAQTATEVGKMINHI